MAQSFGITRMRLERLGDERDRTNEKIQDLLALAEEEQRDLADYENEQITKYRTRVGGSRSILDLSTDIERAELQGHLPPRAWRGRGRRGRRRQDAPLGHPALRGRGGRAAPSRSSHAIS